MAFSHLISRGCSVIRNEVEESLWRKRLRKRKRSIVATIESDFREHPERYSDPELRGVVEYLREKGPCVFPYPYTEKYDPNEIEVLTDPWEGLEYVLHHGKRLYFRRGSRKASIRGSYSALLCEQDPASPHCYVHPACRLEEGSVLFDIGCAEGNFALENIDRVSKVFLFEVNQRWLEALRRTFEPWKDKVVIINKFVSDRDGGYTVTLDSVVREYGITAPVFLKMDVEGAEASVIKGAAETLSRQDTRAAVCTYHNQDDHQILSGMMSEAGFQVDTSNGYMLFIYDDKELKPPYFRRGLIYCSK